MNSVSIQRKICPGCRTDQSPMDILVDVFRRLPRQSDSQEAEVYCCDMTDFSSIRFSGDWTEHNYLQYKHCLNLSERKYRIASIIVKDRRTLRIALVALRIFGHQLHNLFLTMDHGQLANFPMNLEQLKELELGLERVDYFLWRQEVDGYRKCMRQVVSDTGMVTIPCYEGPCRFEQFFMSFVYHRCSLLDQLHVYHIEHHRCHRPNLLLYEGTDMENLTVLVIRGTQNVILADCPRLALITLQNVKAGSIFYHGLRYAFPKLIHLQIIDDALFDDYCLWTISKRCTNLEALTIVFQRNTITQNAFRYVHRLENLKNLVISLQESDDHSVYRFGDCLRLPIERLQISTYEMRKSCIQEILTHNPNLTELGIYTRRPIPGDIIRGLQQIKPSCRFEYRHIN